MPNASTGAAVANRPIRSVPVTRPQRTGSLTATATRGSSPVNRWPGSTMPCSTTRVGELAEDLWGLRQDEAIGQHLLALDIGLPLEHLQPTLKAVLAAQPGAEVELAAVNRRGKSVRVRVGATPLAEGRAEPTGSVLVMHLLSD